MSTAFARIRQPPMPWQGQGLEILVKVSIPIFGSNLDRVLDNHGSLQGVLVVRHRVGKTSSWLPSEPGGRAEAEGNWKDRGSRATEPG